MTEKPLAEIWKKNNPDKAVTVENPPPPRTAEKKPLAEEWKRQNPAKAAAMDAPKPEAIPAAKKETPLAKAWREKNEK